MGLDRYETVGFKDILGDPYLWDKSLVRVEGVVGSTMRIDDVRFLTGVRPPLNEMIPPPRYRDEGHKVYSSLVGRQCPMPAFGTASGPDFLERIVHQLERATEEREPIALRGRYLLLGRYPGCIQLYQLEFDDALVCDFQKDLEFADTGGSPLMISLGNGGLGGGLSDDDFLERLMQ